MSNRYSFGLRRRGFTLIELLVVIGIIIILAALVIVSVSNARSKARDGKRTADLAQIQLAMEMYKNTNGKYLGTPLPFGWPACGFADCTGKDYFGLKDLDVSATLGQYLNPIPVDPLNKGQFVYQIKIYGGTADSPNGYYLIARMENSENTNNGQCYYILGGQVPATDPAISGICS